MSDTIPITFEGETLAARRGEPLAATLAAHGRLALRTTRKGAERGLFCGMGACQDCLVSIDGRPGQRACLTKVDRPMSVRREAEGRLLPAAPAAPPPSLAADYRVERPDVLVVGGGPGGLAAALAARRAGADVLLLDERSEPGGQYFKQSAVGPPLDAQQRRGAALVAEVRAAGVEMRGGTAVWGAFAPRTFAATAGGRTILVEPRVAIVATGAYEQAWPVPGWTLPGVMTTGAAQTLWRTAGRLPGRRVLIAGNGPLNLQLAAELMAGGAEVAVAEAATRPGIGALAELARMAAAAPILVAQGAGLTARLGRRLRWSTHLARVDAEPGDLRATLAGERAESLSVDAVCLGYGFRPSGELLRGLGARHVINPDGRRVVHRDEDGATDAENVFAIGDGTGLGGAHAAMAEGELAGRAAAARLGLAAPSGDAARRTLARHRRFQTALWSLYRTDLSAPSTPDTILCRCEEVTFAEVEAARAGGVSLIGAVKQETRCGMGRCQGRYCAPVLEALLGQSPDEWSGFAPQVPVMPVAIGDLAP